MKFNYTINIKSTVGLVFYIIWLIFAALFYFIGLDFFLSGGDFGGWLQWGLFCFFPTIGTVIRNVWAEAKKGARKGANEYTVTVSSDSVSVENHPFRGFMISLVATVFVSLLLGPVDLAFRLLFTIIAIITYIIRLIKEKKS